jgi:hypothetical protein
MQQTKLDITSGKIPPMALAKVSTRSPSSKSASKRKKEHLERLHNPGGSRFIGRGLGMRKDEEYVSSPSALREKVERNKLGLKAHVAEESKPLNASFDSFEGDED